MVSGYDEMEPTVRVLLSELMEVFHQGGTAERPVSNDQVSAHDASFRPEASRAVRHSCLF
jgi:hypothetical protein